MKKGRARGFDYEAALDAAEGVFRLKGFSGAGTTALMAAMKIGAGSYYSAFSSKENLYHLVLDRASERLLTAASMALKEKDGWDALKHLVDIVAIQLVICAPQGCVFSLTGAHQTQASSLKWKAHRAQMHTIVSACESRLKAERRREGLSNQVIALLDEIALEAALGSGRNGLVSFGRRGLSMLYDLGRQQNHTIAKGYGIASPRASQHGNVSEHELQAR